MTTAPPASIRVVYLTGQSDPTTCELSPVQRAFLESLPLEPHERGERNFPYRPGRPWRKVGLAPATGANVGQFLTVQHPVVARRYAGHVARELGRSRRTLVLAGSCGIELLRRLPLPPQVLAGVRVVAYGPVARGLPDCPVELVVGRRDPFSRALRWSADHVVDAGHFDYLTCPQMHTVVVDAITRLRSAP